VRLDIACGQNKQEGFTGIDIAGDADIKHDLMRTPWPIDDASVDETFCSHFVEHIPHYRPEFGGVDGWWVFFNELHRVCAPGAKLVFVHPYVKSDRAFWDPTHTRFIHETTWYYLDAAWREAQKLDHYHATCDFEVVVISGNGLADSLAARNHEYQAFARQHYWNAIPDLVVELKARKEAP
jgi:SAM-dependent methyltransferase